MDIAKLFVERAPSKIINARDQDGNTWLHRASCLGSVDVVNLLLANDEFLPVCLQNGIGRTALHCAAAYGHEEVARMLLSSSRFSDDALNAVAEEEGILFFPAEKKRFGKEDGLTALHSAAKFGHAAVVETVLATPRFERTINASTFVYEYSALHMASHYGHRGVAEALLTSPAFQAVNALDFSGGSALHVAAYHGQSAVVELLLQHPRFQIASWKNRSDEATAIHSAAYGGNPEVARVLLAAQGRFSTSAVNAVEKHGNTALHTAALRGHVGVAEELLNSIRFDAVNACNLVSGTALHTAAFHGHADFVDLLLSP